MGATLLRPPHSIPGPGRYFMEATLSRQPQSIYGPEHQLIGATIYRQPHSTPGPDERNADQATFLYLLSYFPHILA